MPATATARLDVEDRGYASELKRLEFVRGASARVLGGGAALSFFDPGFTQVPAPLSDAVRNAALEAVDAQLVAAGLLDADTHQVSKAAEEEFGYTRTTSLPTAGVIVKGCLDGCDTCEPELQRERELDLERKDLENQLLKRQIELLDKSQEYRCCPVGADTPEKEGSVG